MKQMRMKILLTSLLMCMATVSAWGNNSIHHVEKNESFTFENIHDGAVLKLSNDYGEIIIVEWESAHIRLDRKYRVGASTIENAQKKLDSRVVDKNQHDNVYSFRMKDTAGKKNGGNYDISDIWTVYVPHDKVSYEIENSFGDVTFAGDVTCGGANIKLSYGNLSIKGMQSKEKCSMKVDFGSVKINNANNISLSVSYGNLWLGSVEELQFDNKFSGMKIRHLGKGTGKAEYGDLTISSLDKKLDIPSYQFGNIDVSLTGGKNFQGLTINASYTDAKVHVSDNIKAKFKLKSEYGDIRTKRTYGLDMHKESSGSDGLFIKYSNGSIGSPSKAKAMIDVATYQGDITMSSL